MLRGGFASCCCCGGGCCCGWSSVCEESVDRAAVRDFLVIVSTVFVPSLAYVERDTSSGQVLAGSPDQDSHVRRIGLRKAVG